MIYDVRENSAHMLYRCINRVTGKEISGVFWCNTETGEYKRYTGELASCGTESESAEGCKPLIVISEKAYQWYKNKKSVLL